VKPASVARVREAGGFLAFADADRMHGDDPGWEPIDRKQVDPGPYYVVWENPARARSAPLSLALSAGGDRARVVRAALSRTSRRPGSRRMPGVEGLRRSSAASASPATRSTAKAARSVPI
jgi:hypothetical protein